jgi:hypothetical protein
MKLAGAYIQDETYAKLVALAEANNRTLAGQCRHLFDLALKADAAPLIPSDSAKIAKVLKKTSPKKPRA